MTIVFSDIKSLGERELKKKIFLLLIILAASIFPGNIRVEAEQASTTKEWVPQAYLPDKITSAAVAAVDRKIYVIGGTSRGRSKNTTYVYDQDSKKWTEKASIPLTVSAASVAVVGKKIYVIGGTSGSTYRKSVQIYDTQNDTWEKGIDIPTERLIFSTASVVDNRIYVMGGNNAESLSANYCYDTETKTWTKKKDLPIPSSGATSQTIDGKIYLIGGADTSIGTQPKINDSIYEYDPKRDIWLKKQNLIMGTQYLTSTVLNGKIYIMGGKTNKNDPTTKVQVYNPKDDSISDFQPFKIPRLAAGAATIGENLYIIGGQSTTNNIVIQENGIYNSVQMYSVETLDDSTGNGEDPQTSDEPTQDIKGKRAILVVTMVSGLEKEFDLSMEEVNDFISWYDQKAAGTGPARYVIDKHENNIGPFDNRKDHVIFGNILTFEVNEYSSKKAE